MAADGLAIFTYAVAPGRAMDEGLGVEGATPSAAGAGASVLLPVGTGAAARAAAAELP